MAGIQKGIQWDPQHSTAMEPGLSWPCVPAGIALNSPQSPPQGSGALFLKAITVECTAGQKNTAAHYMLIVFTVQNIYFLPANSTDLFAQVPDLVSGLASLFLEEKVIKNTAS